VTAFQFYASTCLPFSTARWR